MKDRELGIFLGCVVGLLIYMFMPYYNNFDNKYGVLWYVLNPLYTNIQLWSYMTTGLYLATIMIQFRFVKSRTILLANMFSALLFRVMNAQQDVTVIMFAPLASANPVFSILFVLQKFNLQSAGYITLSKLLEPVYWLLAFWFIFPLVVWARNKRQKK